MVTLLSMVTTIATRHHNQSASRVLWNLPLKSNLPLMVSFIQRGPDHLFLAIAQNCAVRLFVGFVMQGHNIVTRSMCQYSSVVVELCMFVHLIKDSATQYCVVTEGFSFITKTNMTISVPIQ